MKEGIYLSEIGNRILYYYIDINEDYDLIRHNIIGNNFTYTETNFFNDSRLNNDGKIYYTLNRSFYLGEV